VELVARSIAGSKASRRCITTGTTCIAKPETDLVLRQAGYRANVRMRKIPDWERMEAARNEVLEYCPDP